MQDGDGTDECLGLGPQQAPAGNLVVIVDGYLTYTPRTADRQHVIAKGAAMWRMFATDLSEEL